jgi:hypothetical protein
MQICSAALQLARAGGRALRSENPGTLVQLFVANKTKFNEFTPQPFDTSSAQADLRSTATSSEIRDADANAI